MATTPLAPNKDGMTDQAYHVYADAVEELESQGGKCHLALKVFRMPNGELGMAFSYQTDNIQALRLALANAIAEVKPG